MTVDETKASSDFIYYMTKSALYEGWKDSIFIKATIQNISAEKYKGLFVAVPSLEEQQKIVDYLDKEIVYIEAMKAKIEQSIELLQEYKTSLISHAVSGKIKVS